MTNPFFQYPFMTSSRQSKNAMHSYTNDTQVYYCPSVKFSVVGFLFIRPSRFGLLDRFGFQLKVVKLVIISFQKNKSLKVKICICIQLNYQLQVLKAKFLVLRKSCQFIVQYLLASNVRPRDLTYIDRVPYFSQLTRNLFSHLMQIWQIFIVLTHPVTFFGHSVFQSNKIEQWEPFLILILLGLSRSL